MVVRSNNPWESEDRTDLISIGTHKLQVSTSGPARKHGDPVVIMFTGSGEPATGYRRLQRALSKHIRVYFYDRSGYDRSERGPHSTLTAQDAASELLTLLDKIAVRPPYIVTGHSYGGILARAFLEVQPTDAVTGVVLVEPATELMFQAFQPRIPHPVLTDIVAAGVGFQEVLEPERYQLSEEEAMEIGEAIDRSADATNDEDNRGSALVLARARQLECRALGQWPVSIIKADSAQEFRLLYEAGVRKGQGTEAERAQAQDWLERFRLFSDDIAYTLKALSSCHRLVRYEEFGHDVPLVAPEKVVDEVLWVMANQRRD